MRQGLVPIVSILFLFVAACSSTEWVNPTNPNEDYAQAYNRCDSDAIRDPKLQRGNKYLHQQSIERCMAKKGWVLVEKP
ncbi:MAG: hypothetical protein ACREIS_00405 [Nitrospiraceae bacterium]